MTKLAARVLTLLIPLLFVMPIISCSNTPSSDTPQVSEEQRETQESLQLFHEAALPTYKVIAGNASGSAVAVDSNFLVTAAHVVLDELGGVTSDLLVYNQLGNHKYISTARVVKLHRQHDLAILQVPVSLPYVALVLPSEAITLRAVWGARVIASGFPLGVDSQIVTSGNITDPNFERFIQYSAPTVFGNSGGPIFTKYKGQWHVLSICQMVFMAGGPVTHMGLGVNPYHLQDFLGR